MIGKVREALSIIEDAVLEHEPSHIFGCFSGGHDSLTATAIAASYPGFTSAFHANTGIGIEETREFVREVSEREGWGLVEHYPDRYTYRDLVLEMGFPRGPESHNRMLYYLKQRAIDRLVREHKTHHKDRIALVTGIRRQESDRRMNAAMSVPFTRDGAKLWINPIIDWTAVDCTEFIDWHPTLERNEVVDLLHRSGECLCGALAHHAEIEEIERWYPEAAEHIHRLEEEARQANLVDHRWAYPSQAPGKTWDEVHPSEVDTQLCNGCLARRWAPEPPDA